MFVALWIEQYFLMMLIAASELSHGDVNTRTLSKTAIIQQICGLELQRLLWFPKSLLELSFFAWRLFL
jgi:hypothetical protein